MGQLLPRRGHRAHDAHQPGLRQCARHAAWRLSCSQHWTDRVAKPHWSPARVSNRSTGQSGERSAVGIRWRIFLLGDSGVGSTLATIDYYSAMICQLSTIYVFATATSGRASFLHLSLWVRSSWLLALLPHVALMFLFALFFDGKQFVVFVSLCRRRTLPKRWNATAKEK